MYPTEIPAEHFGTVRYELDIGTRHFGTFDTIHYRFPTLL